MGINRKFTARQQKYINNNCKYNSLFELIIIT